MNIMLSCDQLPLIPAFTLVYSLHLKHHKTLGVHNDLTVCGYLESFPYCTAMLEPCDVTQPTYSEGEGQTMALNQSAEV